MVSNETLQGHLNWSATDKFQLPIGGVYVTAKLLVLMSFFMDALLYPTGVTRQEWSV